MEARRVWNVILHTERCYTTLQPPKRTAFAALATGTAIAPSLWTVANHCGQLQNATPLRKSAPSPPNISDEHIFCTAPATRNASLQILFKCPTPAIVFGNATKPSRFADFWEGAQSLAPATRKHIWTSKSAPYPSVFCTFGFEMCFAPQWRALFRHRNFEKWSEAGVFCTFWLQNVLRATTACNFSTSHLARWLRIRRFSERTFRPSGATNHWKNRMFRDFPTFSRICVFFLLTLSLLWSSLFYSSVFSDSSHLCFSSVHIVGSLTSKLPSAHANILGYITLH